MVFSDISSESFKINACDEMYVETMLERQGVILLVDKYVGT